MREDGDDEVDRPDPWTLVIQRLDDIGRDYQNLRSELTAMIERMLTEQIPVQRRLSVLEEKIRMLESRRAEQRATIALLIALVGIILSSWKMIAGAIP